MIKESSDQESKPIINDNFKNCISKIGNLHELNKDEDNINDIQRDKMEDIECQEMLNTMTSDHFNINDLKEEIYRLNVKCDSLSMMVSNHFEDIIKLKSEVE